METQTAAALVARRLNALTPSSTHPPHHVLQKQPVLNVAPLVHFAPRGPSTCKELLEREALR